MWSLRSEEVLKQTDIGLIKMRIDGMPPPRVAFAALLATVLASLPCLPCQLADNLMVSGSDKPMSYGVGTYGLQKWDSGGAKQPFNYPTVTVSNRVPGVIVSDAAGHAKVYQNGMDALSALDNILGSDIQQQVQAHFQQQDAGQQIGTSSYAKAASPQPADTGAWSKIDSLVDPEDTAAPSAMQAGRRLQQDSSILQSISSKALSAVHQR